QDGRDHFVPPKCFHMELWRLKMKGPREFSKLMDNGLSIIIEESLIGKRPPLLCPTRTEQTES
ncbi:hypothetical protein PanWU01x14_104970, partial [Parasponia andersonii]